MTTPHSEPWLDDLRAETAARLTLIARVQDDLAGVYGEAHTAHGRVHVRVNAAGRPTALTLAPAASAIPAADLAAAILAAVDEASTRATERAAAVVGSLVPAEDLDALLAGAPTQADRLAVREEMESPGPLPGG